MSRRPHIRFLVTVGAAGALALAVGCGGDSDDSSTATAAKGKSSSSAKAPQIKVPKPRTPGDNDCAPKSLVTQVDPDLRLVPKPGTYRYTVKGTRSMTGSDPRPMPKTLKVLVTEAQKVGKLRCFRAQQLFDKDLASTGTLVVRGPDVYLSQLRLQEGGQITEMDAKPPVRALDGNNLEWSGRYSGSTYGTYRVSTLGRRKMSVGGKRVDVVGIHFQVTFNGEYDGIDDARRWVALDNGIVVSEKVRQTRKFGVDTLELKYKSTLKSLEPQGA